MQASNRPAARQARPPAKPHPLLTAANILVNSLVLNRPLLKRVQANILHNPAKFDMDAYCGTPQCVAGHLLEQTGMVASGEWTPLGLVFKAGLGMADASLDWKAIETLAAIVMGASLDDATRLFHTVEWPPALQARYALAVEQGNRNHAAVAGADAIDWWLRELEP